MFLMFITALIVGLIIFKLGTYSVIVSMIATGFKIALIISGIVVLIYLYRRYKRSRAPVNIQM